MNENLEPKMSNFCVANAPTVGVNLRNSGLRVPLRVLRAIHALNLNILNLNLFRSDLIGGTQK